MIEVAYRRGVFLPELDCWLDPAQKSPRALVSHAHSDHTGRHGTTVATPITLRLMQARMGKLSGDLIALPFGETRDFGRFTMRLLPAGHVLGSAQCYIESDAGSLLYTGDFKLRSSASAEPTQSCHAETLIMETTFGQPRYIFPPHAEVVASMVAFCESALAENHVPILLGYSLGKAQEILAALTGKDFRVMVHASIENLLPIYEGEGIVFPLRSPWQPANADGHVVVCPPSATKALAAIPRRKVGIATGWAMDASTIYRTKSDAAFPLSDHAGFDDLLRYVEMVAPKRVLTLHGFAAPFAAELRSRGVEAWSLTEADQLELDLAK